MTDRPHVRIDPKVAFGAPTVRGVPCDVIAAMVMAGGGIGEVAADYEISRHEVLLACWHEGIHGGYRRQWGVWAQQVGVRLGGWEPFDADAEEGPPDGRELCGG